MNHIQMDRDRGFAATIERLEAGIAERVAPGMALGVFSVARPDEILVCARGHRSLFPRPEPMQAETVFDLASVSKVFATATAVARLKERGWLEWSTPVQAILPRFKYPDVTVAELLSHTSGLPAWKALYEDLKIRFGADRVCRRPIEERQEAMRNLVYSIPREAPSGVKAVYSDISFLLLGYVIEELTGRPLDQAVPELVWRPLCLWPGGTLGYRRVDRSIDEARDPACAATENCPWRGGIVQGQAHDDNTWCMGGYAGHAGVFGTLQDLLVFARGLLTGKILGAGTLREMWMPVVRPAGCSRTLGWDTPSGETPAFGTRFSRSSVGHLGYTGTSLWIDWERGLSVALLTNRLHPFSASEPPGSTRQNDRIRAFRGQFHDVLFEDLKYSGYL